MENYILSCCSTADLTKERLEKRKISFIPFHFFIDDVEYLDDLGTTMTAEELYSRMKKGQNARTSQVNVEEYCDYFEKFLKEGKDVVHVSLSSGLSGTYNSARIAAETVNEKYKDNKVYVVDSMAASTGHGFLMDLLADIRDNEHLSAKELAERAETVKMHLRQDFFTTDLTYFVKGGRISRAAAIIGSVLKICPVITMDTVGRLHPIKKALGKKRAMDELVNRMVKYADNGLDYSGKCFMCHSDALEDTLQVKKMVMDKFKHIKGDIEIFNVGPAMGSHSGPGSVAIFYMGAEKNIENS